MLGCLNYFNSQLLRFIEEKKIHKIDLKLKLPNKPNDNFLTQSHPLFTQYYYSSLSFEKSMSKLRSDENLMNHESCRYKRVTRVKYPLYVKW